MWDNVYNCFIRLEKTAKYARLMTSRYRCGGGYRYVCSGVGAVIHVILVVKM
jgi:hypothetical protein